MHFNYNNNIGKFFSKKRRMRIYEHRIFLSFLAGKFARREQNK